MEPVNPNPDYSPAEEGVAASELVQAPSISTGVVTVNPNVDPNSTGNAPATRIQHGSRALPREPGYSSRLDDLLAPLATANSQSHSISSISSGYQQPTPPQDSTDDNLGARRRSITLGRANLLAQQQGQTRNALPVQRTLQPGFHGVNSPLARSYYPVRRGSNTGDVTGQDFARAVAAYWTDMQRSRCHASAAPAPDNASFAHSIMPQGQQLHLIYHPALSNDNESPASGNSFTQIPQITPYSQFANASTPPRQQSTNMRRHFFNEVGMDDQSPLIQDWPTADLGRTHSGNRSANVQTPEQPKQAEEPLSPSPGQVGDDIPDLETRRKQALYKQRGEARRASIAQTPKTPKRRGGKASVTPKTPTPTKGGHQPRRKRKLSPKIENIIPATPPPALRQLEEPSLPPLRGLHLSSMSEVNRIEFHWYKYKREKNSRENIKSGKPGWLNRDLEATYIPPPPWGRDDFPQSIVTEYNDYKWSVKLYEINANTTGHNFALTWLCDQLGSLDPIRHQWHTHTTSGFIKYGNRFSFLVLHNATQPFGLSPPAKSSTSIGVYGAYWYQHTDIHWKTYAPDLKNFLKNAENNGLIYEAQKWHVDMNSAAEKRFHRAYWLAANRLKMGGILHSSGVWDDVPHDAVKDDNDFQISESDLSNHWPDVSDEESAKAWEYCLFEIAWNTNDPMPYDHFDTGSSEWASALVGNVYV